MMFFCKWKVSILSLLLLHFYYSINSSFILFYTAHISEMFISDNNVSNYGSGLNEKSIALEEIYIGCVLSILAKVIVDINLK